MDDTDKRSDFYKLSLYQINLHISFLFFYLCRVVKLNRCDMENFVYPLLALESLGFKCFKQTCIDNRNKKLYVTFTHSLKFGVIVCVGYPSVGKSSNYIVENYKLWLI